MAKDYSGLQEEVARLTAENAELRRDRARLEFLLHHPCFVAYSLDGDDCWLHWAWDPQDEERQPWNDPKANSPREAIDLAMAAESKPGTEGK